MVQVEEMPALLERQKYLPMGAFRNESHPCSGGEGIRWWDLLGLKSLIQDTLKAV